MLDNTFVKPQSPSLYDRSITVKILDTTHTLQIIKVVDIYQDHTISKYLPITNCAFTHFYDKSILAIDIREQSLQTNPLNVIVAEVIYEKKNTLLGFVINEIDDFYNKVCTIEDAHN